MTIQTILFDAGDVLYSKPRRKAAIASFLTERGYNAPIDGDVIEKNKRLEAHAGKLGTEEFFNWLMHHYGVEDHKHIKEGIKILKAQQSDVQFFDGVPETLHALKKAGFSLGIVTNTFNSRDEKNKWFKSVGIDTVWDSYADSCELQIVKPDPAIYSAALDPLGTAPQDAAFVGHAQVELDGAKAIGMTTIMFNPDANCTVSDFRIKHFGELLEVPPIAKAREQGAVGSTKL